MIDLRRPCSIAAILFAATVCLGGPLFAADYAPLDCSKAASQTERAICSDYRLGQDEARMATLYALATSLVGMGQRGDIQDGQQSFLKGRAACKANINCIRDLYQVRIRQLDTVMSRIIERGPF